MDRIESEKYQDLLQNIKEDFPTFVSWEFEQIIREILKDHFPDIGSWWNIRGDEIDVVGIDSKNRRILFGEVKWTNRKLGWESVEKLSVKAEVVEGFGRYDKRLMLVSKGGFTSGCKKRMAEEGIIHWDLKSIDEILIGIRKVQLRF